MVTTLCPPPPHLQGDDDLLTVYIGEIFLEFVNMLPAFQTYCLQQSTSVNMLNALEKEKELLRYGNPPSLPSRPAGAQPREGSALPCRRVLLLLLFCVVLNGRDGAPSLIQGEALFLSQRPEMIHVFRQSRGSPMSRAPL